MTKSIVLQPTSKEIWENKYQLKDKDGNLIDKTVEDTYRRVAKTLSDVEPKDKDKHYESFLWALEKGAIPAGRIISNAGAQEYKPKTSTINCVVADIVEDSMDSILKGVHRAGLTLKAGCGIGYSFSNLRPRGSFVNGAGATTSGPLSFMDIFDKMCFTVSSAGGRRGAQMGTMLVRHPDIIDFITAKREDGRLRQFNLSVLITNEFMEAVKNDQEWDLAFPIKESSKDIPEIFIEWTDSVEENFKKDSKGLIGCKIYKTMPAKELWDIIMESTYDYAEPGFLLIDEANRVNNNWFCENFSATNPCVTGDTWTLTDRGLRQVKDLVGVDFKAVVNGKSYDCISNGFFSKGVKEICVLNTKYGRSLRCTPDHKIMTSEGWVAAKDLTQEHDIVIHEHGLGLDFSNSEKFVEGYTLGMLVGDGTFNNGSAIISVWGDKSNKNPFEDVQPCIDIIENKFKKFVDITDRLEKRCTSKEITNLAEKYGICRGNKIITDEIMQENNNFISGFLSGLFDADGTVLSDQDKKSYSVRLWQNNLDLLKSVQNLLLSMGVNSKIYADRKPAGQKLMPDGRGGKKLYEVTTGHELVISRKNLTNILGLFKIFSKKRKLHEIHAGYSKGPFSDKFTDKLVSREAGGTEEVYDCTVKDIHAYDANGIYISNCGEQNLPPNGSCLLGSINLTKFVSDPFTDKASFNFFEFTKCVKIFTRMLDNVVEINGLPLPEQVKEIERKRRHGMGYLGLGSTMTMLTMKYGSDESLQFTEKVSQILARTGFYEGVELAKEKGPAPIFNEFFTISDKNKKLNGKELFVQSQYKLIEEDKALRDAILQHGCRFTHHSSIAPTGTISLSLANNVSNGIEPTFSHEYSRNVIREGRATKEKVKVCSFELLAYRHYIDPNAKVEDLPDYFVTTDDITPMDHINVQAAAQPWIDSSISKTINVPSDFPFEDFKDIYMEAYKRGLKGCTTFRFNPEAFQGVLVKEDDLENTYYEFTLEDGEVISAKGNEMIMYDGQEHTAANLYDAIKEGYYGKL